MSCGSGCSQYKAGPRGVTVLYHHSSKARWKQSSPGDGCSIHHQVHTRSEEGNNLLNKMACINLISLQDYHHQLVCITEREKFLIPVRALGPRAVLDFPDELHFPTAPVKYASTKTVLVRNVGNHEGKFDMEITRFVDCNVPIDYMSVLVVPSLLSLWRDRWM